LIPRFSGLSPIAIFFASLTALLLITWGDAGEYFTLWPAFFRRSLGITGVEATAAASNVFVGIGNLMLTIRPLSGTAQPIELAVVLTAGMATIRQAPGWGSICGVLQPLFPRPFVRAHLDHRPNLLSAPAAV